MLVPALCALGVSFFTPDPDEPTRVIAEARDVPEGSRMTLHLVDRTSGKPGPAIFAKTEKSDAGLRLTPSFGLARGATYRAVVKPPNGADVSAEHTIPLGKPADVPSLGKIYPTAEKLPANLLKFYLYFTEPMRESRDVFDQIHIEDDRGERVHAPWRRRQLWSENATRLTLWIHPGRIKRGVNLREELGPVLEPNRKYTLVIDETLRSAAGVPLGKETRHGFSTIAEDYERPLPESWNLALPKAGTRDPLKVTASEPLDHILIERHVKVINAEGTEIAAEITLAPGEAAWAIRPKFPWKESDYRLVISGFLEDLAGNTRLRVFDTDLTQPSPKPGAEAIPFRPSP